MRPQRAPEREHARDVYVELAATGERGESTDRAPCVRRARKEQQIGARAGRLPRPALDRRIVHERE